jgi:hypothetical protein
MAFPYSSSPSFQREPMAVGAFDVTPDFLSKTPVSVLISAAKRATAASIPRMAFDKYDSLSDLPLAGGRLRPGALVGVL